MRLPFEFDPSVNALYYKLASGEVCQTASLGDRVQVDLDENMKVVGVEILDPPGISQLVADAQALSERIRRQRAHLAELNRVLRRKNKMLDALHWVWCDGGCPGGVHRWHPELLVTKEMVEHAELQAERLRSWYNTVGYRHRLAESGTSGEYLTAYARRAAARTDIPKEQEKEDGQRLQEQQGRQLHGGPDPVRQRGAVRPEPGGSPPGARGRGTRAERWRRAWRRWNRSRLDPTARH